MGDWAFTIVITLLVIAVAYMWEQQRSMTFELQTLRLQFEGLSARVHNLSNRTR